MLEEAKNLQIIETESEVEALIKEAELIKKHLPKYNVLMRDDKNYFYIGFTKEVFPRILITHQLDTRPKSQIPNPKSQTKSKIQKLKHEINYMGPFTDGGALKITLRLLRRIFPYCTCKELHKRPCLNAEIGRCSGFCCLKRGQSQTARGLLQTEASSKNQEAIYKKNIKNVTEILSGKKRQLLSQLKREMRETSKKQEFEKAAVLRDQIQGLENIFAHRLILKSRSPAGDRDFTTLENLLQTILQIQKQISRIEGYDISNISGHEATGSMVVFVKKPNGYFPDKSQYRKFKIKTVHQISDVDMIHEVVLRRLAHLEWRYPDLIIIDGGKQQLSTTLNAIRQFSILNFKFSKPIITALAKKEEELYTENRRFPIKLKKQPKEILHLFQRIRDESHRFAKKYHHKLREQKYKNG